MTDDIVKRLREGTFGSDVAKTDPYLNSLMQKAADEIERLREHSRLRGLDIIDLGRMAGKAEWENERFRKALKEAQEGFYELANQAGDPFGRGVNKRLGTVEMCELDYTELLPGIERRAVKSAEDIDRVLGESDGHL